MVALITQNLSDLERLCRHFHVARLELFGSATTGGFDADHSDLDFSVRFQQPAPLHLSDQYFGLAFGLEVASAVSEAPRIISFRNTLIHGYDLVDDSLVRDVVVHKLPGLSKEVETLMQTYLMQTYLMQTYLMQTWQCSL